MRRWRRSLLCRNIDPVEVEEVSDTAKTVSTTSDTSTASVSVVVTVVTLPEDGIDTLDDVDCSELFSPPVTDHAVDDSAAPESLEATWTAWDGSNIVTVTEGGGHGPLWAPFTNSRLLLGCHLPFLSMQRFRRGDIPINDWKPAETASEGTNSELLAATPTSQGAGPPHGAMRSDSSQVGDPNSDIKHPFIEEDVAAATSFGSILTSSAGRNLRGSPEGPLERGESTIQVPERERLRSPMAYKGEQVNVKHFIGKRTLFKVTMALKEVRKLLAGRSSRLDDAVTEQKTARTAAQSIVTQRNKCEVEPPSAESKTSVPPVLRRDETSHQVPIEASSHANVSSTKQPDRRCPDEISSQIAVQTISSNEIPLIQLSQDPVSQPDEEHNRCSAEVEKPVPSLSIGSQPYEAPSYSNEQFSDPDADPANSTSDDNASDSSFEVLTMHAVDSLTDSYNSAIGCWDTNSWCHVRTSSTRTDDVGAFRSGPNVP
jgi:hypothetical protein